MRWISVAPVVLAFVIGALGGVARIARAQEPPPVPLSLTLRVDGDGTYRLEVHDEFAAIGAYEVGVLVRPIGSDNAVVVRLAESDSYDLVIDLPLPLDGMSNPGCYYTGFFVTAVDVPGDPSTGAAARINTRGCVDAADATSFPAFDGVTTPPPAPPTNVRLVPQGDDWRIAWDPAPSGEVIAYQASAALMDAPWAQGGATRATVSFPEVPADWSTVGPFSFFGFSGQPPAVPGCGSALLLVFAIGPDAPSIWPGNATVPYCWDGAALTFPATGDGTSRDGKQTLSDRLALAVAVLGAGLVTGGIVLKGDLTGSARDA